MLAAALVDYDNVCRTVTPENRPQDVALNLDELLRSITLQAPVVVPGLQELQVRLYGGWIDRSGRLTSRAQWITTQLADFRRRLNRIRVRPSLVTSLAVLPDKELLGTYRADADGKQKMVDGMITIDALHFAARQDHPVLIISDDDDFVPALIGAHCLSSRHDKIVLMRRNKPVGTAPNDTLLLSLPLKVTVC